MEHAVLDLLVFACGLAGGVFVSAGIDRAVGGPAAVFRCKSCGRRFGLTQLIPVFSWLGRGGRCAGCGARISPRIPFVEAANGLLWVLVFRCVGSGPAVAALTALFCSALLAAGVTDANTLEIPPGAGWFILALGGLRLFSDLPHWPLYALGFFAVSVPLGLVWLVSGGAAIGGGDVKLMAACGLFLGWRLIVFAFLLGCVLGAVIHCCRMAFAGAGRVLALGPYLAAGCAAAALCGNALLGWYLGLF